MNTLSKAIQNRLCVFALLLSAATLSGCDSSSTPQISQGNIVNTAIAGLTYSTATQSGVTDANGSFDYIAGETITFSIGEHDIAEMSAKSTINWFELGGLTDIPVGLREIEAILYDDLDLDGDGIYDAPSLSRVAALASLLVTFDDDFDSSNGIVIAPNVAALLTSDINIRLEYASSLRYNDDIRGLIRQAAFDGVMPARNIRNGSPEVEALYRRLGVDPNFKTSGRHARDGDGDGAIDWARNIFYDVDTGRVSRDEYDTDNDGLANDVYTYTYTAELDTDSYDQDLANDGSVNRSRVWERDVFGDLIRYSEERNGMPYQTETRDLDPKTGLYIRREVINPVTNVHTIETWTMDADGNRPLATIDNDGDGTPDVVVTLTYDAPRSQWTGREDDFNGDGAADSTTTRQFDQNGNLTRQEHDNDADGSIDFVMTRTYNNDGYLVLEERDANNDGIIDASFEHTFDGKDLLSYSQYVDGQLTNTYSSTYDERGLRLTFVRDSDGDGTTDFRQLSSYDSEGRIIEQQTDNGDDGSIDSIYSWIYDANGDLLESRRDLNGNGDIDRNTLRHYDTEGYLTLTEELVGTTVAFRNYYENYLPASIASYL